MSSLVIIYVTCADAAEARLIGRTLVEERLAACVNLRSHDAIYRWQGAVEEGVEYGMLVKTAASLESAAIARIKALHSYELPGIASWRITGGDALYLRWIEEACGPSR